MNDKPKGVDIGQKMGVTTDSAGNVILNFGADVSFVSFPPITAIELAKSILRHSGVKAVEIDGVVTTFKPRGDQ